MSNKGCRTVFVLIFFVISLVSWGNDNLRWPRIKDDPAIQAECWLTVDHTEPTLNGHYKVWFFGDTLSAEYRHTLSQDYIKTDDVMVIRYKDERLGELEQQGKLGPILQAASVQRNDVVEVVFFGIEEQDDHLFEMELWKVKGALNATLKTVGKWQESYYPCRLRP